MVKLTPPRDSSSLATEGGQDKATLEYCYSESGNLIGGFHIAGCGDQTIRFRPALIFQPSHANYLVKSYIDLHTFDPTGRQIHHQFSFFHMAIFTGL